MPVPGVNTSFDDVSARLTPDELTIVFSRKGSGGMYDLYIASRSTRDASFEAATLLTTVNSVNSDVWPTLSPDGLLLAFDSDRATGQQHVYVSRRTTSTEMFKPPTKALALMDNERHPMLPNGRALYFASARTGTKGMNDIWRAEIDSTGATSTPTAVLGEVNTDADEVTPAATADELRIFVRRTVGNEHDVYTASRATAQDGFGTAATVPGLAEVGVDEVPTWVSPDGCALYIHSDAMGGAGGVDLYVARRGS